MLLNPLLPETSSAAAGGGVGGAALELRYEGAEENGEEELRNPSQTSRKWSNEETLALLKVRSQMNHAFLEAAHKSPLWDELSRKMGEIGYHRSAKKCKEKFENIYKYNRRTKKVQSGREKGKSYRFLELLEILDNQSLEPSDSTNEIQTLIAEAEMAIPLTSGTAKDTCASQDSAGPCLAQEANLEFMSISTSSKSSSERHSEGRIRKKRRITNYIEKLMNNVLEKQQDLHNKFLEAIEKYEKDRLAREEAWKTQEMARIKKEQAAIAQERALVAAKDAALIAFLQKISGQEIQAPFTIMVPLSGRQEIPVPLTTMVPQSGTQDHGELFVGCEENNVNLPKINIGRPVNVSENWTRGSSSRWPKEEVEALVRLRSNFDLHENGPKGGAGGPLWEEISSELKKLGYDRSSKKCKEKWENMNKYYRRVKDANKKRPEDSKTCPYYNLLESLYENRSKRLENNIDCSGSNMKPEYILMQMMTQEQHQRQEPQESVTEQVETHINRSQGSNQDDDEDGYHSGY